MGGGGGGGGAETAKRAGEEIYRAAGGDIRDGGLVDGKPIKGTNGGGCHYGGGDGGDGGSGFPGETRIVEFHGLSEGDRFEIKLGQGGDGGDVGGGYEQGDAGVRGVDRSVVFAPLFAEKGDV